MKYIIITAILALSLITKGQEPMKVNFQNSALSRWLGKEVIEKRVLDNMDNREHWVSFSTGAISLVDSRISAKISESETTVTEMKITDKETHGSSKSLLVKFPSKLNIPGPKSGRGWGNAGVRRIFDNENWSKFNRISLWIYPDNREHIRTGLNSGCLMKVRKSCRHLSDKKVKIL